MMDGYGMGTAGWIMMFIFWAVLLGLIFWAVVRIFPERGQASPPSPNTRDERPLEILDRRLAQGEIDPATYDELRARLTGDAVRR
jgi:putative membrane protein